MVNDDTEEIELPRKEDLQKLPRKCMVAYAARNALRVFPLLIWNNVQIHEQKKYYTTCAAGIYWAVVNSYPHLDTQNSSRKAASAVCNIYKTEPELYDRSTAAYCAIAAAFATNSVNFDLFVVSITSVFAAQDAQHVGGIDFTIVRKKLEESTLNDYNYLKDRGIEGINTFYTLPLGSEEFSWYRDGMIKISQTLQNLGLQWILDLYTRINQEKLIKIWFKNLSIIPRSFITRHNQNHIHRTVKNH
ncbi:MAG: hypothetical protein GX639_11595 [Fibrobacter sp.]|nr:hypothetical protein [Fibrobacter sp.]